MSGNVIGGVLGAAIGFMVGGPVGAQWGWMLGGVAGGILMPPEVEGPRLTDLRPQGSEYGRPIPITYGTVAVAGNVIWQTDLEEEESGGGKGEPSVNGYSYYANFAVLLCESDGTVELGRIWAGPEKRLIYDGAELEGGTLTFYNGAGDQLPDPLMESHEGIGNVPAYRGYAYIVIENFPVLNDGNRVPFLTVEVGNVVVASDLGTVWTVGEIFIDEAAQTYSVSYSGSREGIITRSLVDDSFVYHSQWESGYVGNQHSFYDPDRNRIIYMDAATFTIFETDSADTYHVDVFSNWPGLSSGDWRAAGGVYHQGAYHFLMHNISAGGVAISIIDPDDLTVSLDFHTGDAGFAVEGLAYFCGHRDDGDGYILGATEAGTVRKYPISAAFTSTSCGASVPNPDYVAVDPNTGFVWAIEFDTTSDELTVTCNDPVTEAQLYSDVISTTAFTLSPGARRSHPFVFGNGKVIIIMQKWLAIDYFVEFDAATPAFSQIIEGRYHGTGSMSAGIWNPEQNEYWFVRAYGWFNRPVGTNDLTYVSLSDYDNDVSPGAGFYLADTGVTVTGTTLDAIVEDLCDRAGLTDIDVSDLTDEVDGYLVAQQTTVRGAIQALQPAFFFDAVESDGIAKFVKRGSASVVTISDEELGAYRSGGEPDADLLLIKRQMEDELPSVLNVKYMLRETKYDVATKQAKRLVGGSGDEQTMDCPIVMTDTKAKEVAETNLHKAWVGRKTFSFMLPLKYTYLEPTDVITINGQTMMLTRVSQDGGILKCEGVFDDYNYDPHVVVTETPSGGMGTVIEPAPTYLNLMNLEALREQDRDAGFYAAATTTVAGRWRGATLYQSKDGGASYNAVGTFPGPATMGTATDALDNFTGGDVTDTTSSVNIRMIGGGTLSSTTEDGFLAGVNVAAIGNEVIYFRYAALELDGSYTLTRFKRGRFGSTAEISGHALGDKFTMLSVATVIRVAANPIDIGETYLYKAVSVGSSLADTVEYEFINTGAAYDPLTPIDVGQPATLYGRDPNTTTGLTWGYYGGAKLKADGTIVLISAGTVALTDDATNYIYATDAGVVTVTTSIPTDWPAPLASDAIALYEVTTVDGLVTAYVDYRTFSYGGGGGGGGTTLPVADTTAIIKGSGDPTKLVRFEVDGLTAATTRVVTVPDKDGTMAMTSDLAPFTDATALIKGSADPSKLVRFEADGLTAATTRVVTVPDKNGTMAMLDDITAGVALTTVNVFTKNQSVTPVTLVDGATINTDASLSNNFDLTLGGNRTLANPTNLTAGMVLNYCIHQDGTGARTLAFGNLFKFPGGVNSLSATPSAKDFMSCYYDGTILRCNITKAYQ